MLQYHLDGGTSYSQEAEGGKNLGEIEELEEKNKMTARGLLTVRPGLQGLWNYCLIGTSLTYMFRH